MKISLTSTPLTMNAGWTEFEPPVITSQILNLGILTIIDGFPKSSNKTVFLPPVAPSTANLIASKFVPILFYLP